MSETPINKPKKKTHWETCDGCGHEFQTTRVQPQTMICGRCNKLGSVGLPDRESEQADRPTTPIVEEMPKHDDMSEESMP